MSRTKTLHIKYRMDADQLAVLARLAKVVGKATIREYVDHAVSEYSRMLLETLAKASKQDTAVAVAPQSVEVADEHSNDGP